jgi:nitroreductase
MAEAVLGALRARRSVGRVTAEPVPREVVRAVLEAATWAPNHRLTQPWRFVVLTGGARAALGEAHARAVARARPETPPEGLAAQAQLPLRAPVVVVCICRPTADDPVVRREDRDAVAAAVQNLLLAAHAHGLGAMWRTGVMPDEPEVRDHLGLGDDDAIVGFVYLGYPAVDPSPPERDPVDAVVEWRDF